MSEFNDLCVACGQELDDKSHINLSVPKKQILINKFVIFLLENHKKNELIKIIQEAIQERVK